MAWAEVLRGKSGESVLIGEMFILVATICNIQPTFVTFEVHTRDTKIKARADECILVHERT